MVDPSIYAAGIGGMVGGLLWQGILPYFLARKKAEQEGRPLPSFGKEYATTMLISTITGFIAIFMAVDTFEKAIINATSIMVAAGIGFSFTYTVLGISNTIVDLKIERTNLTKQIIQQQQQQAAIEEEEKKT